MTLSTLTRIARNPHVELAVAATGFFWIAFYAACQI
jgi:hypothetical protein